MRDSFSLRQVGACNCVRPRGVVDGFHPGGHFKVQHVRNDKVLAEYDVPNDIMNVGMDHILNTEFHATTPITAWYIGLVNNTPFTGFDPADTMSSHTGWVETSLYDEANRRAWDEGAASGRVITSATTADFTISGTVTVKGLFICGGTGADTKGGTTGTLWSAAAFSTAIPVIDNDVLKITYSLSG